MKVAMINTYYYNNFNRLVLSYVAFTRVDFSVDLPSDEPCVRLVASLAKNSSRIDI